MDTDQVKQRVESFDRWHYQFDLDGVLTPIHDEKWVHRHNNRYRYFFTTLVDLCGGSLRGKRVLDLGCNAGFWSLKAIEHGCDEIVGVDGRQMHIDQAELVFEVKGVEPDRFRFVQADIFDCDFSAFGRFDIVLCLGLLYHVSKPVELFERITAVNDDLLVIDTTISARKGSMFVVDFESLDEPRHAFDRELIFRPTRDAVVDVARAFGYEVVPLRLDLDDYSGMENYQRGQRLAFMCATRTDISGLPAEPKPEDGRSR